MAKSSKKQTRSSKPREASKETASKSSPNRLEQAYNARALSQSKMYEALKFDASNVYFSNLIGAPLNISQGAKSNYLPGILVFRSALNINSRSDMVNVAATSIYTFVRHANAGRTNYESSDLMMYLLAMSEIYVGLAELIRAYGLASYFTRENLYSGHILTALGFDPYKFRNNLADIRYRINNLINKVKAFAVPRAFNLFDERISEYMSVYLDDPSPRGQMIAVRPARLGKFDPTAEGGGAIKFISNIGEWRDVYKQIEIVEDLINVARRDEDMNIISGDIMKAYGDNLFHLSPIEPDFKIEPIYDELFLIQIQNGHFPYDLTIGHIIQENNRISQTIELLDAHEGSQWSLPRFINSPISNIDANLIFAFSKYQITTKNIESNNRVIPVLTSANTTVLFKPLLYYFNEEGSLESQEIYQVNFASEFATPDFFTLMHISKFKYHMYLYNSHHSLPIGDMHYVAKISTEDTARMNDARFILAFQTQQMG